MLRDKSTLVPLWDRLPQELVARVVTFAEPRALVTLVFIERRARDASQQRLTALRALRLPPCSLCVHAPRRPDAPRRGQTQPRLGASGVFGDQWSWSRYPHIGDNGALLIANALASGLMPLKILAVTDQNLSIAVVRAISPTFCNLPQLEHLNFSGNRLGDDAITVLARAFEHQRMHKLRTLYLEGNRMGDSGAAAIASAITVGSLQALIDLDLPNNQISDAGASALAASFASGKVAHLETLYMQDNRIGDAGMQALAAAIASHKMEALVHVYLHRNAGDRKPVDAALDELRAWRTTKFAAE